MNFKTLNISLETIKKLEKSGIKVPTPVQKELIPIVQSGKDAIVISKTGSGKTLAFLLPIVDSLLTTPLKHKTLILVPTRELGIQIMDEVLKLDPEKKIASTLIYGGKGSTSTFSDSTQIIIATPGRFIELIKESRIDLSSLKTLILDEADQMLLLGFKSELEFIISKCAKNRQTLFLSATIGPEVKKIAYRFSKNPLLLQLDDGEDKFKNIEQYKIITTDRKKLDNLCSQLNADNPFMGIIFCRTKVRVDKLDESLMARGYSCQKIHSDIPQSKREKILKSFKNLEVQFLIATDVVSRGIDITGVTHVYNYDIPENSEIYTHRVGRTGRGKEHGVTYTFIDPKDFSTMEEIERELEIKLTPLELEHIKNVSSTLKSPQLKYDKRVHISSKRIDEIKNIKKRAKARD